MKRKWARIASAFMIVGLVLSAAAVQGDDDSYWNSFKSIFVDWDDNAPEGSPQTQTVGVRGIGVEKALSESGYDWQAVVFMETVNVPIKTEKVFLEEANLGPFQK